jgi:hypothetical protein
MGGASRQTWTLYTTSKRIKFKKWKHGTKKDMGLAVETQ